MYRHIWLIIWLLSLMAIILASLLPGNVTTALYNSVAGSSSVKANSPVLHFVGHAFFYMGSTFVLTLWLNGCKSIGRKHSLILALLLGMVLGFGMEFSQAYLVPKSFYRNGMNPYQAFANCLGAFSGWVLATVALIIFNRVSHPKAAFWLSRLGLR